MILYPLQLDEDGGLLMSNDPLDIVASEVQSILNTVLWTRPLRMDYGSKTYVLGALELGQLLVDLSTKLVQGLEPFGYSNIQVNNTSTLPDLQQGQVYLTVGFKYGGASEALYYQTTIDNLRDRDYGSR